MKLIIAGSRNLKVQNDFIFFALEEFIDTNQIEIIVSGGADGIDKCGEDFGYYGLGLEVVKFPADWNTHGKAAGPIRNKQMAEYGDALLLIWDGTSKGSANMRKEMLSLKKPVYEIIIKKTEF